MATLTLPGDFLRSTRGLNIADGGGVTWAFNKATNTLSVSAVSGAGIAADSIGNTELRDSAAVSLIGRSANSVGDPGDIVAAGNDTLLRRTANTLNFGQLTAGMFPAAVVPDAALSANVALYNAAPANFAGPLQYAGEEVGLRRRIPNLQNADYVLVLGDAGKMILHASASAHAWTVPPNSSVAFPLGTQIMLVNRASGAITITQGAGVAIILSSTNATGNKTLVDGGQAIITKTDGDVWVCDGAGVS